jgi:hypothetical protein
MANPGKRVWGNHQWVVTSYGIEAMGHNHYNVPMERLATLREGHPGAADWPLHVAERDWVDIEAFLEAFFYALDHHRPEGHELVDRDETARLARKMKRGFSE